MLAPGVIALAALLGAGLAPLAGCNGKARIKEIPSGDSNLPGPDCLPPDASENPSTAWDASLTAPNTGTLCPKFDDDFWRVPVAGTRQLTDVLLTYNKSGEIDLTIDWLGPRDLCLQSPLVACTDNTPCSGGQCDTLRGACRSGEVECFDSSHCGAAEACTRGQPDAVTALVPETESGPTIHQINTTLPAFIEGDYFIRVYDRANHAEDADAEYTLTVSQRQDPDVNEPNDSQNMATPITSDTPVSGYFSYHNDEDWFVIQPSFSTPAIFEISLSWPDGMQAVPAWVADQQGTQVVTVDQPTVVGTTRVSRATRVLPSADPIYVRVYNTNSDIDSGASSFYTLDVRVFEDPDPHERSQRDDSAQTANTQIAIPNINDTGSLTQHLIAENDKDWYKITNNDTSGNNGLLNIQLSASMDAPFLLKFQALYPTGQSCSNCSSGGSICSGQGCLTQCIQSTDQCAVWFQRPAIHVPDSYDDDWSEEYGGPSPNDITSQIPFYPGEMYILVEHIQQNLRGKIGYGDSHAYTLTLTHKAEPDSGDQSDPDNFFIPHPLMGVDGVGHSGFFRRNRDLNADTVDSGSTNSATFAMLTSDPVVEAGVCTPLSFELFNGRGVGDQSGSVTITSSAGATFYDDSACTTAYSDSSFTLPTDIIYYSLAAPDPNETITTNTGTSGDIPFDVVVYANGGTAPPVLIMGGARAGEAGARSDEITVTIPGTDPSPAQVINLTTLTPPPSSIVCHRVAVSSTEEQCVDTNDLANACSESVSSDCNIQVVSGSKQSFHLEPSDMNLIVVKATDPNNIHAPATWVYAPSTPGSYQQTLAASGVISYEGDADFFAVGPIENFDLQPGVMTATLHYTGGINLRASIVRIDDPESWCWGSCGISIASSDCDNDPCVEDGGDRCYYVTSSGDFFHIWVNVENHDAWNDDPIDGTYQIWFTYEEGCAARCNQYACQ